MQVVEAKSRQCGKRSELIQQCLSSLPANGWPEKTINKFKPAITQIMREAKSPIMMRFDEGTHPCGVIHLETKQKQVIFQFRKNGARIGRLDKTKPDAVMRMIRFSAAPKQIKRELKWLYEE